jgi:hypothetical protein
MNKDIWNYIVECDLFQRNKSESLLILGLFHPLHIPNHKWEEISMDFIESLPMSKGKDKILLVVGRLTKYAHFMGVKKIDSAKQTTKVLCKNVYKLHGFPNLLSVIKTPSLKGIFGNNFVDKLGHL